MTKYGICEQSLVPVRTQSSDQSEMINQLLFGDLLTILDIEESWCFIATEHDSYEGWIDIKQVTIIEKLQFDNIANSTHYFLSSIYSSASTKTGIIKHLLLGSKLPNFNKGTFSILHNNYSIDGKIKSKLAQISADDIETIAMKYIGVPYLWGGRSPFGIDCSGFTQIVYSMVGINMKRDAYLQVKMGEIVNFVNESHVGDLAFFDNTDGKITHVGIIINNNKIIHASGEVRIDNLDHQGIYNEDLKKYTHKLRIIKRVIFN